MVGLFLKSINVGKQLIIKEQVPLHRDSGVDAELKYWNIH